MRTTGSDDMSGPSRFIFVTGGVVSSLGKGIASASIGAVLEARGFTVSLTKLDPYLNVDPGTMNPFQHGEVFVTADGAETDLDLGHYERFVDFTASKHNNHTAGQIYERVIRRERKGEFLGSTVQVIPHVTDEIKLAIFEGAGDAEIALVEIGGTAGDIESLPFLEAIRQLGAEMQGRSVFVHLTLVPRVSANNENKTKPTQHSVKELRSIGIQPDLLLCRTSCGELSVEEKKKISLFTNVPVDAVFSAPDVDDVYRIPVNFYEQKVDEELIARLGLKSTAGPADLGRWKQVIAERKAQTGDALNIAIVGKYIGNQDAYKSLNEALDHAGLKSGNRIRLHYVDAGVLESQGTGVLDAADAVLVPGGFGARSIEGKVLATHYARERKAPYLGICLGMQVAVIEFARNVAGLSDGHSTEFMAETTAPVVALVTEWCGQNGNAEHRGESSEKGGTMRLGAQQCLLEPHSLVRELYGQPQISERHRHRYEVNNGYRDMLSAAGMRISGKSPDNLVEVIELVDHPWFIGCQFHPEFQSTLRHAHPLFLGFVNAAKKYRNRGARG